MMCTMIKNINVNMQYNGMEISSVNFYPSLNKSLNSSNYYVANASKKTQMAI